MPVPRTRKRTKHRAKIRRRVNYTTMLANAGLLKPVHVPTRDYLLRPAHEPQTTQANAVNEKQTPRREYVRDRRGVLRRKHPKTPKGKAAIKAAKRSQTRLNAATAKRAVTPAASAAQK